MQLISTVATQFVLQLETSGNDNHAEIVFVDPRRLGRIRLCTDPLLEPPISELAADPILNMPSVATFIERVGKKSCTIKSLLLDQKDVVAGIGNWIADEVLFHARIHPEQKPSLMSKTQLTNLHENIKYVCEYAVSVDADASQFPEGWLFKHRWVSASARTF
jgi:formamidopyrimidine-DNA glycosylase